MMEHRILQNMAEHGSMRGKGLENCKNGHLGYFGRELGQSVREPLS
jgi:hypothetical protein